MKNTLLLIVGILIVISGAFTFIYKERKKETSYYLGYSDALDTLNVIFTESIEDTSKVSETNIINCNPCNEEDLRVDTSIYVISPKDVFYKPENNPKKDIHYYMGYKAALDTISHIISSHLADTNRITKITIVNYKQDLKADTNSYTIHPKNKVINSIN